MPHQHFQRFDVSAILKSQGYESVYKRTRLHVFSVALEVCYSTVYKLNEIFSANSEMPKYCIFKVIFKVKTLPYQTV